MIEKIFKKIIYLLYKIKYFGKLNFINIDYLKKYKGPAILISNHSYVIDLFIPIILNNILKRNVYVIAAAYPFTSKFKMWIAKKLGIIFVTKRLSTDELKKIANDLKIIVSSEEIIDASNFYNDLANKYNFKAKTKIRKVLKKGQLIYSFAQYHQPFFEMEKGSVGLGKMILEYNNIPVFPISIVDISNPPVEIRRRNENRDLKRIDLLTDKQRKIFSGEVNIIFNHPLILKNSDNFNIDPQDVIDEIMIYLGENIPDNLKGYYRNNTNSKELKYFKKYE